MLTFYDYLPSQNAWKVRQVLKHLTIPHRTEYLAIFKGAGQTDFYRQINPTGAVPAVRFDDGRVLAESNAILFCLAQGSALLPQDTFAQAKVLQWLNYEADYVQNGLASLRYWTQTGRRAQAHASVVSAKVAAAERTLKILEHEFSRVNFLIEDHYSIADIALYAYVHRAEEAELSLTAYPHLRAWFQRVAAQPGHLAEHFGYACDPASFFTTP